ncbi:kinetochore protein Spc25-like [Ptychodera flava]|uniref:kinetochore protein Spc25-like n=1 Tax=Ptychodera flava TaxID=63121 RepID=UPI00396A334B
MLKTEAQNELQRLQGTLDQVKDKLLNKWTGDSLEEYLEDVTKSQQEVIKKGQEKLEALGDVYSALQEQAKSNKQMLQEKIDKMNLIKKNLEEMRAQTQKLMMESEEKQILLNTQTKKNQNEKELLATQQKFTKSRLDELEKAAQYFTERMSLDFRKQDGEKIQVVFTNIDPDDATKEYYFTVKVDGDYEVVDCQPTVDGLDTMVEKLNKTNHFSLFVINIRRKFREMVI